MLDIARQKLSGVPLHCGDMRSFRLATRFDAVTCLYSSIGYLASIAALDATIVNMASHLADVGLLIVEPWHHHNVWPMNHSYREVVLTDTGAVERLLNVSVIDDVSVLHMEYTVTNRAGTTAFTGQRADNEHRSDGHDQEESTRQLR